MNLSVHILVVLSYNNKKGKKKNHQITESDIFSENTQPDKMWQSKEYGITVMIHGICY